MKKIYLFVSLCCLMAINTNAQSPCQISLTSGLGSDTQSLCKNVSLMNITYQVSGTSASIAGLPSGVNGSLTAGVFTISGTPTIEGAYTYTLTTTGGCSPDSSITGSITIGIGLKTAGTDHQNVCKNIPITNIEYSIIGGGTLIVTGLPRGIIGNLSSPGVFTISGTPTIEGTYNYTINTTGTCASQSSLTGSIIVGLGLDKSSGSNVQNVCKKTPITPIRYNLVGGNAVVIGLPGGIMGSITSPSDPGVFTISGTPTTEGIFNYTVTTTGTCGTQSSSTGSIIVGLGLDNSSGSNIQNICKNATIAPIKYTIIGGSAIVNGLPGGIKGSITSLGDPGIFTISGTPTIEGIFGYTVTTTGTCGTQSSLTGTFTIGGGIDMNGGSPIQTLCNNTALTPIKCTIIGGNAVVTGLPPGVVGSITTPGDPCLFTISGTPNVAGVFAYNIYTTGSCVTQSSFSGTITTNEATASLTSGAGSDNQTICTNSPLTNITYFIGGTASGATVSTLPSGLSASFSNGNFTISGTPIISNGKYTYTVTPTGGTCSSSFKVFTITKATSCPLVTISVSSTDASNNTICNGTGNVMVTRGTPPYTISLGNNTVIDSIHTFTNLCAGFYTAKVKDAANDSASFTFVVGSPATTFVAPNPTLLDSTIVDTLITNAILNCVIDYSKIDSIAISNFNFVGSDSIHVTWTIFQTGGNKTQNANYSFSLPGVYTFILDLFCINRTSGSVKGIDKLYIGKNATGIETYETSNISIYPNPFNNLINVVVDKTSSIKITNIIGSQAYSGTVITGSTFIETGSFNSGIYFINITNKEGSVTKKIIKN